MRRFSQLTIRALLSFGVLLLNVPARADVLVYNAPLSRSNVSSYFGEAFKISQTGGPWDSITINFYALESSSEMPEATGKLFIFSKPYTGPPAGLDALTPTQKTADGFLADVVAQDSHWDFGSLALDTGTTYFIYTDTSQAIDLKVPFGTASTGVIPTADSYRAASDVAIFGPDNILCGGPVCASIPLSVSGTAVPEPSAIILMCTTLLGVYATRRRIAKLKAARTAL